jgi:hypothetical protein
MERLDWLVRAVTTLLEREVLAEPVAVDVTPNREDEPHEPESEILHQPAEPICTHQHQKLAPNGKLVCQRCGFVLAQSGLNKHVPGSGTRDPSTRNPRI